MQNTRFLNFMLLCDFVSFQNLDIEILRYINNNRYVALDEIFIKITNSAAILAFVIPVIFLLMRFITKDILKTRTALYLGISVLISSGFSSVLKYTINRDRPFVTYNFIQKCTEGGSPSFPSGHTSDAFAIASALSLAYPKWYIIAPSFLWAGAIAYSRMDLGVHYPSDVLAGAIIGTGSSFLCFLIYQNLKRKLI